MRVPKTTDIIGAECMVRDYEINKAKLKDLKDQAITGASPRPEIQIFSKGNDRDSTMRSVLFLDNDTRIKLLEVQIAAVDYADLCCVVYRRENGDKVAKLMYYVYGHVPKIASENVLKFIALDSRRSKKNIVGAAVAIGVSNQQWAGKLIRKYLRWIDSYFSL
jgi:hypothetical protein